MTKAKSSKKGDHIFHQVLHREAYEYQPPTQRGCGEGNEGRIIRSLSLNPWEAVMKLEILEIREESNEVQDLSGGAVWLLEGKESESWGEVSEALANAGHKFRYLKVIYPEFLEVCESGKVTQGASTETFGGERIDACQADSKPFDERKQTKFM